VTRIWVDGLRQTVDAAWWIFQPLVSMLMSSLESSATSISGDFGPQGVNISHHWMGEDRIMFVALKNTDTVNEKVDDPKQPPPSSSVTSRVIGCCCIKRGASESIVAPLECTEYSIYRLSVAEDTRCMGVGQQLTEECERWAKNRGGKLITLTSGNSKAGEFYCKRGYVRNGYVGYVKTI